MMNLERTIEYKLLVSTIANKLKKYLETFFHVCRESVLSKAKYFSKATKIN